MYRKEQYIRRKQMHHPDANDAEEVVVPSVTALVGILLTGLLYLVLPPNLIIGPNWLLLVMEGVFVVPLVSDVMTAWNLSHTARRILVLVPLAVSTLALIVGVALFILTLPTDTHATNLLRSAALLWSFNILVFALWYWEVDGGGPWKAISQGTAPRIFCFHNKQLEGVGRRIFWIICSSPLPRQPR
jgi:hypothetical protein